MASLTNGLRPFSRAWGHHEKNQRYALGSTSFAARIFERGAPSTHGPQYASATTAYSRGGPSSPSARRCRGGSATSAVVLKIRWERARSVAGGEGSSAASSRVKRSTTRSKSMRKASRPGLTREASTWRQRTGTSAIVQPRRRARTSTSASKPKRAVRSGVKQTTAAVLVNTLSPHCESSTSGSRAAQDAVVGAPRELAAPGWWISMFESGRPREAIATWQWPTSRSRSRCSSSSGVLRSASLKARCSPRARSMPSRTAAPLPLFPSKLTTVSCGHLPAQRRASAAVSSVLPSSTTITSYSSSAASRYCRMRSRVPGSLSASLYAGTTTLRVTGPMG